MENYIFVVKTYEGLIIIILVLIIFSFIVFLFGQNYGVKQTRKTLRESITITTKS